MFPIYFLSSVFDSWGKPGLEIQDGDAVWLGNFDQCLRIKAVSATADRSTTTDSFSTRYCTINLSFNVSCSLVTSTYLL